MLLKLHKENLLRVGLKENEIQSIQKHFITVLGDTYYLDNKVNKLDKNNKEVTLILFMSANFGYTLNKKNDADTLEAVFAYIASNVYDSIDIRRNILLKEGFVEFDEENKTIIEWVGATMKIVDTKQVPQHIKDRYIKEYLEFFPDFENLLRFIVSSNISADKKFSFGLIVGDSNKGKSVLMEALAMANISKTVMGSFPFKLDASPYTPEQIVKPMAIFIDEFKKFYDDYKDLTDTVSMAVKYGVAKTISIGCKLFANTKLTSDLAGGGVDEQIYNRLAIFEINGTDGSLGDLPSIRKYGEAGFKPTLAEYAVQKVRAFIKEYEKQGEYLATNKAGKDLKKFKEKFGLKAFHKKAGEVTSMGETAKEKIEEGLSIMASGDDRIIFGSQGELYLKAPLKTLTDALKTSCSDGEFRKLKEVVTSLATLKNETGIEVKKTSIYDNGKKVTVTEVVLPKIEKEIPVVIIEKDNSIHETTTTVPVRNSLDL